MDKPTTWHEKLVVSQVLLPGVDVTTYAVIGEPFGSLGTHSTVMDPSPRVALTDSGFVGKPAGVTENEAVDTSEFPTELVATTVKV